LSPKGGPTPYPSPPGSSRFIELPPPDGFPSDRSQTTIPPGKSAPLLFTAVTFPCERGRGGWRGLLSSSRVPRPESQPSSRQPHRVSWFMGGRGPRGTFMLWPPRCFIDLCDFPLLSPLNISPSCHQKPHRTYFRGDIYSRFDPKPRAFPKIMSAKIRKDISKEGYI